MKNTVEFPSRFASLIRRTGLAIREGLAEIFPDRDRAFTNSSRHMDLTYPGWKRQSREVLYKRAKSPEALVFIETHLRLVDARTLRQGFGSPAMTTQQAVESSPSDDYLHNQHNPLFRHREKRGI